MKLSFTNLVTYAVNNEALTMIIALCVHPSEFVWIMAAHKIMRKHGIKVCKYEVVGETDESLC